MMEKRNVRKLTIMAIMIALCYVSFAFLKITIPTPLGHTSFHLGNVMCLVAALILGGAKGGLVGAIGMGIGDILDPLYVAIAPKTMILKMIIGLVTGLFAHKIFKINEIEDKKVLKGVVVSNCAGMLANIIGEPVFGYFYYKFILQAEEKALSALVGYNLVSTSINAIISIVVATTLYMIIRNRFKKDIKELND